MRADQDDPCRHHEMHGLQGLRTGL